MTRRQHTRLVWGLMGSAVFTFGALMAVLAAGQDPTGSLATTLAVALLILAVTSLFIAIAGDRMVTKDETEQTR